MSVVSLIAASERRAVANEAMVESLRGLLERALSGEIQGGAFVVLTAQDSIETGWAGNVEINIPSTLGAMAILNHRLVLSSVGK